MHLGPFNLKRLVAVFLDAGAHVNIVGRSVPS